MAALAGGEHPGRLAAVVLAGGRAARLGGTDKPGITILGRSLLSTVAGAAIGAGADRVVIVGPPRPGLAGELRDRIPAQALGAGPAVEFTTEQPPGAGPVAAIRAGLRLVAEPWLLLLAADLPFLRGTHLRELLAAAAQPTAQGAMFVDEQGNPQWLASCWRTEAVRAALAGYGGGSLRGVLGPLRPAEVTAGPAGGRPPPWLDCDTQEDVAAARALAGHGCAAGPDDAARRHSTEERGSK